MYIVLIIILIIFIIFLLINLTTNYIFEGLQQNNDLPLLKYDISNVEQVYHPTYIDTNINAIGGFALPVFDKQNHYKYSNKIYVPNYIDTIYMSSLTGLSNVAQYYDVSNSIIST